MAEQQKNGSNFNKDTQGSTSHLLRLEEITPDDISLAGGKAVNLGILLRAGLPVPPGYCITSEVYDIFNKTGQLPEGLLERLTGVRQILGHNIAIRSSANCEDGERLSMAGVFESHYVTGQDSVKDAIEKIYRQAQSPAVLNHLSIHQIDPVAVRMGLVVQELIDPQISGVIYTGVNDGEHLLIQYVSGFGEKLVDGTSHGAAALLHEDSGAIIQSVGFEAKPLAKNAIGQSINYSGKIEQLFEGKAQDIEFAYRDGKMFILQARPLTTELGQINLEETTEETLIEVKRKLKEIVAQEKHELGVETAIFSDTNFSELLPTPTEMDIGVFAYIFTGSDGIPGSIQLGRKEMGYLLGDESVGLMYYIGGKPYLSIARDAATFYGGFPKDPKEYFTSLVNEYLATVQDDPGRGHYPEMGLYLQDPTLEDLQSRFGEKAPEYYQIYQKLTDKIKESAETFQMQFSSQELPELQDFIQNMQKHELLNYTVPELLDYTTKVLEHLRLKSCISFVKAARLGFYYSQKLQSELRGKFNFDEQSADLLFAKLSQGLDDSLYTEVNIAIAKADSREQAVELARKLVGHYSKEELEIRHPRLKDDEGAIEDYAGSIWQSGNYLENFEKQKTERLRVQSDLLEKIPETEREGFEEIVKSAQTYMALRETVKYYFTQEYSLLRDCLEKIEDRLNLEKGDIYYVYPREISKLVNDPSELQHIIRSRKQAFKNYSQFDFPAVIRESDIEALDLSSETSSDFTELKGKFLAEGAQFDGVIINLDEFEEMDKVKKLIQKFQGDGKQVILVATQLNLSQDPLILMASGLIIENAGIVSHGAQRARELGKGAIGGIKSRYFKTGMEINFDPSNRSVQKIIKK